MNYESRHQHMTAEIQLSFQQEKIAEVKDRIINAAFICFGRHGYQGAILTQIAEVARCSRELPRYHFKSKEGLVLACLSQIRETWNDIFTEIEGRELNCTEFIDHILSRANQLNANHDERMMGRMVLIFGAADPGNPTLRGEMLKTQMLGHKLFANFLTRYAKNNPIDPDINVPIMSKVLFDAFRGVVYHYMMAPDSINYTKLLNEYKKLFIKVLQPAI